MASELTMNTGQINGGGGIDRNSNPTTRVEHHERSYRIPRHSGDSAAISDSGRDILSVVEAMSERLASAGEDRLAAIESARHLLEEGALDQPDVFLEASRRMFRAGF